MSSHYASRGAPTLPVPTRLNEILETIKKEVDLLVQDTSVNRVQRDEFEHKGTP